MDCFANIKIMFSKDFHHKTFAKKCEKHENFAFFANMKAKFCEKSKKLLYFLQAIKM